MRDISESWRGGVFGTVVFIGLVFGIREAFVYYRVLGRRKGIFVCFIGDSKSFLGFRGCCLE